MALTDAAHACNSTQRAPQLFLLKGVNARASEMEAMKCRNFFGVKFIVALGRILCHFKIHFPATASNYLGVVQNEFRRGRERSSTGGSFLKQADQRLCVIQCPRWTWYGDNFGQQKKKVSCPSGIRTLFPKMLVWSVALRVKVYS